MELNNLTHDQLFEQYKQGDTTAFTELVERLSEPLRIQIQRIVRDPNVAKDILQETFVQVINCSDQYRKEGSFDGWVYTIAKNLAINWYNQRKRRGYHYSINAEEEEEGYLYHQFEQQGYSPLEQMHIKEIEKKLDWVFAKLPEEFYTVFVLYTEHGLKYREIAELIGITLGTVKTRLHRARGEVAALLNVKNPS